MESTEAFEYSEEFREMIVRMHRGKENLPGYQGYLKAHLGGPGSRLSWFTGRIVPEIEYHCGSLKRKRVLDFGCGTGATTVALAQNCGDVSAFDIDAESIEICRKRLREHGLEDRVKLYCGESVGQFAEAMGLFDVVVMNGVMEHVPLTIKGLRRKVLMSAFSMLDVPGYLYISGTPNRLHPHDVHTTGFWFTPWTRPGTKWVYDMAVSRGRFNPVERVSDGPLGLEETGAWGVTYWEIMRYLRGERAVCLNVMPHHDRYIFYRGQRSKRRNLIKTLLYLLMVKVIRTPVASTQQVLDNIVILKH